MIELATGLFSDDRVTREIGNGIWAILGLEILIAVNWYLWRTWKDRRVHPNGVAWHKRLPVRMAIAINIYMIGSDMRAFWVWALLECQNRTMTPCVDIRDNYFLMLLAVAFAIAGGLYLVRLMTLHWENRATEIWLGAAVLAVAIPIAVHIMI